MAREISLVCNFIFGSIHTSLPTDMVDVELTVRTVMGIYTYRKDHTAESTVFSPWSRTVIPFPLLHRKIQAFQNESRQGMVWDNNNATPYFSAPPKPKHNPRKHAPGRTRTRWSNRRHRFSPIKMDRYNTCDSDSSDWNKLDTIQPNPRDFAIGLQRIALIACAILHIPPQFHQTGLVKTGMVIKQKQENRGHSLTSNY